jgi:predicted dehydrogenase
MANAWVKYAVKRENAEIVALVDIREESALKMKEKYDLNAAVYTDLAQAIKETQANLVLDVTIPEAHHKVASVALNAGCHVLGEKPLAASMEAAEEMVALAKQTGLTYAVMQNRRYLPHIRSLQAALNSNTIGQLTTVNADFYIGAHFGGFRDAMQSPLILDMAIHTFDQARFIMKANPVSVYCHEFNPAGSWYQGNASAICIFEMSNGAVFTYRGSWCAEGFSTSWQADWRIIGTKGTALWNGQDKPKYEVIDEEKSSALKISLKQIAYDEFNWSGQQGHDGCFDEMYGAIEEGRQPETVCFDNIESLKMVFGAIKSAQTGQKVMI